MTTTVTPANAPAEEATEHPHVARVTGAHGSISVVRGTRIPVRLIAQMYRAGDSVEDILASYPQLQAGAVHDAISYYLDHREEIEQDIVEHRIENALAQTGAQMDPRGFISFPPAVENG